MQGSHCFADGMIGVICSMALKGEKHSDESMVPQGQRYLHVALRIGALILAQTRQLCSSAPLITASHPMTLNSIGVQCDITVLQNMRTSKRGNHIQERALEGILATMQGISTHVRAAGRGAGLVAHRRHLMCFFIMYAVLASTSGAGLSKEVFRYQGCSFYLLYAHKDALVINRDLQPFVDISSATM